MVHKHHQWLVRGREHDDICCAVRPQAFDVGVVSETVPVEPPSSINVDGGKGFLLFLQCPVFMDFGQPSELHVGRGRRRGGVSCTEIVQTLSEVEKARRALVSPLLRAD